MAFFFEMNKTEFSKEYGKLIETDRIKRPYHSIMIGVKTGDKTRLITTDSEKLKTLQMAIASFIEDNNICFSDEYSVECKFKG